MTKSQEEIDKLLDKKIASAEKEIDKMFAERLKEILFQLSKMYTRYGDKGNLTFTDLNRYGRFQKEMKAISEEIGGDFKRLEKDIQSLMETQYIENFLRTAFLLEFASQTEMGFGVPSIPSVKAAILNPIDLLKLPELMDFNRKEVTRRIRLDISSGLMAGEGYTEIAERLEKSLGFGSVKAKRVARTEAGRAQSLGRLDSFKQGSEYSKIDKVWLATLDERTRHSHRKLDGKSADKDGYFHYNGHKALAPRLFMVASLDINCRCSFIGKVNGMLPELRRSRNEEEPDYQKKLAERIEKYMGDGLTHSKAEKKAKQEIKPPSLVIPYQTYEEWYKKKKKK